MTTSILTSQNSYYDSGWRQGIPWLYYVSDAKSVIQKDSRMKGTIEFQTSSSTKLGVLNFVAAKYSLEGDFLGFEDLTSQLQLCGADYTYGKDYREFGKTVQTTCKFDPSKLIDSALQPNNTDIFYELFMKDVDGNYIDIPVKIQNYLVSTDQYPNHSEDINNWKLTRRFFIYDTLSGVEGNGKYAAGSTYSTYVRWLHTVKIMVELDPNSNDKMYIPYVELEYRAKSLTNIDNGSYDEISFEAKYSFDPTNYWIVALIIFAIINGVVLLIVLFKIYCWARRHPKQLMGSVY